MTNVSIPREKLTHFLHEFSTNPQTWQSEYLSNKMSFVQDTIQEILNLDTHTGNISIDDSHSMGHLRLVLWVLLSDTSVEELTPWAIMFTLEFLNTQENSLYEGKNAWYIDNGITSKQIQEILKGVPSWHRTKSIERLKKLWITKYLEEENT